MLYIPDMVNASTVGNASFITFFNIKLFPFLMARSSL